MQWVGNLFYENHSSAPRVYYDNKKFFVLEELYVDGVTNKKYHFITNSLNEGDCVIYQGLKRTFKTLLVRHHNA
jgi:hypothetical protein